MSSWFDMTFNSESQEDDEPELICRNTFLEYRAVAPRLRKSSSLPSLCELSDDAADHKPSLVSDRSTECSTTGHESGDEFTDAPNSPASSVALSPFSNIDPVMIGMPAMVTPPVYASPGSEYALHASMRLLIALIRTHVLVTNCVVVPKKRNVLRLSSDHADSLSLLQALMQLLETAEFVCGQPRLGRKESQLKFRIFDAMPADTTQICLSFAKKGKCKWTSCKSLHPRTCAAVICI